VETSTAKIGVVGVGASFVALPVMACAVPAAVMTSAERECCQKMAGAAKKWGWRKIIPVVANYRVI